jgi:hypothetical protein
MKKLPFNLASFENHKLESRLRLARDIAPTLVSIRPNDNRDRCLTGDINRKLVIDGTREAGSRKRNSHFDGASYLDPLRDR